MDLEKLFKDLEKVQDALYAGDFSVAKIILYAVMVDVKAAERSLVADYSNFPFSDFTVAEIFALMRESKDIGDTEFVDACREAIRLNKCRPTQDAPDLGDSSASDSESKPAPSG